MPRVFLVQILFATAALVCAAQTTDGIQGHTFRDNKIGLSYNFPESLSAEVETTMPWRGPRSDREHMILALWSTAEHNGAPRIAFLHDTKPRSPDLSRAEIANRYLAAIRQLWLNVPGVKIAGPQKIVFPGCETWRIDLYQPDALPHYNSAVVIPLADRSILAIQVNAPSQGELDDEVNSLQELRLDKKLKP